MQRKDPHKNHIILPCVFCDANSAVLVQVDASGYFVRCRKCGARGPVAGSAEEAIARWNDGFLKLEHYINQMGRWVTSSKKREHKRKFRHSE